MTDLSEGIWNLPFNHNNFHISTTIMPMAIKPSRVVTYHEGLTPIKSHDPLITVFQDHVTN